MLSRSQSQTYFCMAFKYGENASLHNEAYFYSFVANIIKKEKNKKISLALDCIYALSCIEQK